MCARTTASLSKAHPLAPIGALQGLQQDKFTTAAQRLQVSDSPAAAPHVQLEAIWPPVAMPCTSKSVFKVFSANTTRRQVCHGPAWLKLPAHPSPNPASQAKPSSHLLSCWGRDSTSPAILLLLLVDCLRPASPTPQPVHTPAPSMCRAPVSV